MGEIKRLDPEEEKALDEFFEFLRCEGCEGSENSKREIESLGFINQEAYHQMMKSIETIKSIVVSAVSDLEYEDEESGVEFQIKTPKYYIGNFELVIRLPEYGAGFSDEQFKAIADSLPVGSAVGFSTSYSGEQIVITVEYNNIIIPII